MADRELSRFILHVSDFHLTDNKSDLEYARSALKKMTDKLKREKIKIDYLFHTGDIIDSSDLYEKAARKLTFCKPYFQRKNKRKYFDVEKFKKTASTAEKKEFDKQIIDMTKKRFNVALSILNEFIADLNISFGNVVICSGNHDIIRPTAIDKGKIHCAQTVAGDWKYNSPYNNEMIIQPFEDFLCDLNVANCKRRYESDQSVAHCVLDNLNIVILNTNWLNPYDQKQGYYCVRCDQSKNVFREAINYSIDVRNCLNVVLAHKPVYEICEKTRLSYKRYIKTAFMSELQKFIGSSGIYLCGDKHTRSIIGSNFHDIPHYIGGEPLKIPSDKKQSEVEYNLLEISQSTIGIERKIHLKNEGIENWSCDIRPQDAVVAELYDNCKDYIFRNTFEFISGYKSLKSWESICQEIYNWDYSNVGVVYKNLNKLFQSTCKYRMFGTIDVSLRDKNDIFQFVLQRIKEQLRKSQNSNLLNIRGEHSSGKSIFLATLYIYLLYQYSVGLIDFIPAYFNLENDEVFNRIVKTESSYYLAVKNAFDYFSTDIQKIANKEHQKVCYIIDGLDEQDCWSYSTEDSVGRVLLDILSEYTDSLYIMSFSQQRLPCFKNTMPTRTYNDISDIMYFNPIDIQERESQDTRFFSFVQVFVNLEGTFSESESVSIDGSLTNEKLSNVCDIIRNFRRLTINPGFIYQNYRYIMELEENSSSLKHSKTSSTETYKYYLDRQNEICLENLGYGFINYAPAMAYLFANKGFTYERFKKISAEQGLEQHILNAIASNHKKIYKAFVFIKKNKDARNYLIALHFNREIRYYVEHPQEIIGKNSILNDHMTRDVALFVRKMWTDPNKFVIACNQLLNDHKLNNCGQSMLYYCLSNINLYAPIRDRLRQQIWDNCKNFFNIIENNEEKLSIQDIDNIWRIDENANNLQKLQKFLDLSLLHSIIIFSLTTDKHSKELVRSVIPCREFQKYNRQYQMLYYGDLSIKGEDKKRPLDPGRDVIYKGFDFHNTFQYLYTKLNSREEYALREFDLFTLLDLVVNRLKRKYLDKNAENRNEPNTFFYWEALFDRSKEVLKQTAILTENYLRRYEEDTEDKTNTDQIICTFFQEYLDKINSELKEREKREKKEI